MISIIVKHEGGEEVIAKYEQSAKRLGDLRPVWKGAFQPWILDFMRQQFLTQGRAGGRPWAGYGGEPRYAAFKQRLLGHNRLFRWDHRGGKERLYPALTTPNHPDQIFAVSPTRASIGVVGPYAQLERGGVGPFKERFPARMILPRQARAERGLLGALRRGVLDYLSRGTQGQLFR